MNGKANVIVYLCHVQALAEVYFFPNIFQEVNFKMDADPSSGNLFFEYGNGGIFHLIFTYKN